LTTLEQGIPLRRCAPAPGAGLLWRLAVPLAAWLALASYALYEVAAEAAAETAALAFLAAVVLLPVAALARRPAEVGLGAALVVAAAWVLPHGPAREAVVLAALVALAVLAAARRLAVTLPEMPLSVALPLALAAQALLRAEVLLPPLAGDLGLRLLVILLALPAVGALATARLARRHGAGPALVAAGAALLLGPGWNVATTAALVALAAVDLVVDREAPRGWRAAAAVVLLLSVALEPRAALVAAGAGLALATARWRRAALAALGTCAAALLAVTAILAAPPWLRREPLSASLGLLAAPVLSSPVVPLAGDVALDPAAPVWEAAVPPHEGKPVRAVVLDSTLAHSAALPRGTPVATVRLIDATGGEQTWTLRAGLETGEWAAGRPDLAASLRAGAPEPWLSWVVGDFLARRYRARWDLGAAAAARIRVERLGDLPPEVVLALHHLELRP
jgi:hypothetical protein